MPRAAPDPSYLAFLRSRWPDRARLLALYALGGSAVFMGLDWVFTRPLPSPPGPGEILLLRAPWMAIPLVGWLAQRLAPRWRLLPALVMAISLAWAWGNAAAYFALGLAGTVLQAIAVLMCLITSATFMPLTIRGRAAILTLMALGHVALDVAWPQAAPLGRRLWNDAIILAFAACITVVFENFAASQRRGLQLRRDLERSVAAQELARCRAEEGVAEVGRLAAAVAHDVNNPLSAVKVNVRWLGDNGRSPEADGERAEVVADALAAVERISRIVAELRRQAVKRSVEGSDRLAVTPAPLGPERCLPERVRTS